MIWLLAALTCYRLTRLITADVITQRLRVWVADRSLWASYLVSCDWCMSVWIAPIVAIPAVMFPDNTLVLIIMGWFSLSAVTGLLSVIESKLDN